MKRLLTILLCAVLVLSVFSACGETVPGESSGTDVTSSGTSKNAAEILSELVTVHSFEEFEPCDHSGKKLLSDSYTYTVHPDSTGEINSMVTRTYRVLNKGCLARLDLDSVLGNTVKEDESYILGRCLFNDESKALMPLCFDVTCDHRSHDCFSRATAAHDKADMCYVFSDNIVSVDESRGKLLVTYYAFDGTVVNEVVFDMKTLPLPQGIECENFSMGRRTSCRYGDKLYVDVANYNSIDALAFEDDPSVGERLFHWILCVDVPTGDIHPVARFRVSHPYESSVDFLDCDGERIACSFDGLTLYTTDLTTGVTESVDIDALVSRVIRENPALSGGEMCDLDPLKGILTLAYGDGTHDRKYVDLETFERVELSRAEILALENSKVVFHEGETYYLELDQTEDPVYELINAETGEVISGRFGDKAVLLREGEEDCNFIGPYVSNSGVIFGLNIVTRHGLRPVTNTEVRVVNGVEVFYRTPIRYVYYELSDLADGGDATPWVFDPETGVFEKQ